MRAAFAVIVIILSLGVLEFALKDVHITQRDIGHTPVTEYAKIGATGPVVVVAHGFAGSQQMMQGYALPLARAGYRVLAFEFLGHGQHPLPMLGDVTVTDGTTRLLVEQTAEVIRAIAPKDGQVALLGHSMATDVLVRVSHNRADVGPVVLISAFSQAVDATTPSRLLLISGAWDAGCVPLDKMRFTWLIPIYLKAKRHPTGPLKGVRLLLPSRNMFLSSKAA